MLKKLLAAGVAVVLTASAALAVGLWPGLPLLGGPSYCGGYSVFNTGNTVPGTLPSGAQCATTVPAGSTAFTGNEGMPTDSYAFAQNASGSQPAPTTQLTSVLQFGQGGFTNLPSTSSASTYTVPATTAILFENATVTNPTITFTAAPLQGQMFTLVWGANLTTGITTAAGAGSTCLPACGAISGTTAGTTHKWVYEGTIWYQIQ